MLLTYGFSALLQAAESPLTSDSGGFFAQWLAGLNIGAIVLLLIGIALIIVEMIMPGFGIAGVAGTAAIIAGLAVGSNTFGAALFSLAIVFVILLIAAPIIFKVIFGKRKRPSKLVLNESIDSASNDRSTDSAKALVGKNGVALTALRPSGIAMIDGKRIDVLADGEFIAKGDKVTIVSVQGTHISVVKAGK
ncbi:MAG: hypothetical protein J1E60_04525 [Christensenellaceae bacterium]|nr:hypothetical protein [Christensenellaceae bacterium]